MLRPSSDQAKLLIAVSDLVSCSASPPAGLIAKIWFLSSTRLLVNANHSPSGDQRGLPEDFSPRVSWTFRPLLTSASQDRKSTRLNSSHTDISRMPSSS